MIGLEGKWNRIVVLMFVLLCGIHVTVYGGGSHEDLLHVLKSGIDEQLNDVEFKCTYTYSSYVVDSLEEAESFNTSKGKLVIHATGVLAKSRKMTYESFVLDTLETRVPEYLMNHITASNSELQAVYRKQSLEHNYRTLFVLERPESDKNLPVLNQHDGAITCPLTLGGSRSKPNFVDVIYDTCEKYPESTELAIANDDGFTTVSMCQEYDKPELGENVSEAQKAKLQKAILSQKKTTETTYVISNAYPYPVLTEKRTKTIQFDGEERHSNMKALDFVRLNNGCVLPQKIYMFSLIVFDDFGKDAVRKWLVSKWESDDMGKEKPKKSDFYIYLDHDSDIRGLTLNLNSKLEDNLPEYFDINKYGIRDLQTSSPIESQVDRNSDLTVLIRPAILLIAGFFIVYGIWKKWKTAKRSAAA